MSDDDKQNQTQPPQQQPVTPQEQPKSEPKSTELPKPNRGETVTKGG